MYTNSSCILYLKSNGYIPIVIDRCFFIHRKLATSSKEGLQYQESAFVMFQAEKEFVFTEGKDYVTENMEPIHIDTSNEKSLSDGLKQLSDNGYTVMIADHKNYGSESMRHWELSCK